MPHYGKYARIWSEEALPLFGHTSATDAGMIHGSNGAYVMTNEPENLFGSRWFAVVYVSGSGNTRDFEGLTYLFVISKCFWPMCLCACSKSSEYVLVLLVRITITGSYWVLEEAVSVSVSVVPVVRGSK